MVKKMIKIKIKKLIQSIIQYQNQLRKQNVPDGQFSKRKIKQQGKPRQAYQGSVQGRMFRTRSQGG